LSGGGNFGIFVIPGKHLAAMEFCPRFALGWSHACRKGFSKNGGAWKATDLVVCKTRMVLVARNVRKERHNAAARLRDRLLERR
jgi:hypothetical protein